MPKPVLMQRLAQLEELTPSEKKLADIFRTEYPQLAFDNLTDISAKAGVGKATVTRFVQRLGYMNFYDFSRALRDEVVQHMESPLNRLSRMQRDTPPTPPAGQFSEYLDTVISNLQRTKEQHSGEMFARAVELLADTARPLFLMGAASAEGLLSYFSLLLCYFRDDVTVLNGNVSTVVHRIVKMNPKAVLLTFSYDRYPKITQNAMRVFHQAGCESILITERRSSPILRFATVPIVVAAEGPTMFKSRCAGIAALEALLAALTPRFADKVTRRLESMTRLFSEFDVYLHH
jgi:DNA-binding MurR/RpiR family transcriptional regulator